MILFLIDYRYVSVFIRHKKYLPLFLDEQISEYVLQRIIRSEKDRQGLVMAEALGTSF